MKLKYLIPVMGLKYVLDDPKGGFTMFTLLIWYNFAFFGTAITLLIKLLQ